MNRHLPLLTGLLSLSISMTFVAAEPPAVPRFSVENMDKSVNPSVDFYHFAAGTWLTNNPVPADKSSWSAFAALQERNWFLLREILESSAANDTAPAGSPRREVGV